MKSTLFTLGVLSFALAGIASAQPTASSGASGSQFTSAQLKKMAAKAHTPEQYSVLASAYSARQQSYLQQAAEERKEWIRRSQNIMVAAAKYPRPVDSARYLYEDYTNEAAKAGQLAAKYQQLAVPASPEVPR
jgi:hypothetical protein